MYASEETFAKLLSVELIPSDCFFVELNLRQRKWLISSSYILYKNSISKHIEMLIKNSDLYSSQYESNFINGDINVRVSNPRMIFVMRIT